MPEAVREQRPSVIERLAEAMVSDDLSMTEDKRRDVDHLAALGAVMVGRPAGISAMLHVALTHDRESLREVMRFATALTRRLAAKRRWKLTLRDIEHIAKKAVQYQCAPSCPSCNGRGRKVMKGTPVLSSKACEKCHGTGKRPFPIRHGREIAEVAYAMGDYLTVIEDKVRKKLG